MHAHLWTDDYLDLMVGFGKTDTGIQRGKGAGTGQAEMDKRFATMDAAGVDLQVLSISPQFPHFENKERAVTRGAQSQRDVRRRRATLAQALCRLRGQFLCRTWMNR